MDRWRFVAAALGFTIALTMSISGQSGAVMDWPQWRGPDRTGVSRETGLLKQWPPSGPPLVWSSSNLGAGFGSIAVAGDHVFVQGLRGRDSVLSVLNRADGKGVWSKTIGPGGENDRGSGPRSTPTVDGDRVYVLTETGNVADRIEILFQLAAIVATECALQPFGVRRH